MSPPRESSPGGLAGMHPAIFGMVMATGIVSIASHVLGLEMAARALYGLNLGVYAILWILLVLRMVRHGPRVAADLGDHARSVGFFTVVAATCVLGSQSLLVGGLRGLAEALWLIGIALWAVTTFGILTLLTIKETKPPLEQGLNGGWLVAVVAAQSVSALGSQLAPGLGPQEEPVLFFSLCLWLGGGMLYIWIISLIFYRYTFFTMRPSDLSPPYWVNMGAAAISTLAGSLLIAASPRSDLLAELRPFLEGLTLLFWSTATWWIPMLVLLGLWRHVARRFPLRYDPLHWGAVFPLGMYTACTVRLSEALGLPWLMAVPRAFIVVALSAWALTMAGLLWSLRPRRAGGEQTVRDPG